MPISDISNTALSLWNGSSNNAPPSGWTAADFDDASWEPAVITSGSPNLPYRPPSGSAWIWSSSVPITAHEGCLIRSTFGVPPGGAVSGHISVAADDIVHEAWLNGTNISGLTGFDNTGGGETRSVDISALLLPGAANCLALYVLNNSPGGVGSAGVAYLLEYDVTGTSLDTSHGTSSGGRLSDTIRARHRTGPVCWEHDGTIYRVLSGNLVVLQTPFPTMSDAATALLGRERASGLPMWTDAAFLARKQELPVDTGGQGQVPAPDSTLPDDPPAPTTLQTDKPLPPIALPDPVIDNCPIMRCGAAYYLAQKLKEQYDIVRNCLLGMLAAPFLLRIPAATAPFGITILDLMIARLSDSLIGQLGADILWLTRILTKLNRWSKVIGAGISVATDFEDIHEEGITILQRLAYPCLTCSENIFNLSQDMVIAWELAINADTTDFTDWQRHLLVYILQCTPFGIYHTVAAQGAAITSDTCGGF